jgi:hypothetical protein
VSIQKLAIQETGMEATNQWWLALFIAVFLGWGCSAIPLSHTQGRFAFATRHPG